MKPINSSKLIRICMVLAIALFSSHLFAGKDVIVDFNHISEDPLEATFVVELDEQGNWSKEKNTKAFWNVHVYVNWTGNEVLPIDDTGVQYYAAPGNANINNSNSGSLVGNCGKNNCADFSNLAQDYYTYKTQIYASAYDVYDTNGIFIGPVASCHYKRSELLQQGLALNTILKNDWLIDQLDGEGYAQLAVKMKYYPSGGGSKSSFLAKNVIKKVLCKGNAAIADSVAPLPVFEAEQTEYKVTYADLKLNEQYGPSGVCKVLLNGELATNHPQTKVRFRYEHTGGEMSEIKEVTSGQLKLALFQHEYSIPNQDGPEGGAIRMIGVEPEFETEWRSYSMDCVEDAASDLQANLPPQLHMQVAVQENVMVGNQLCPSKLIIQGKMTGLGSYSGQVAFVGDSYLSSPQDYSIENGQVKIVTAYRDLNWNDQGNEQSGGLQANPNPAVLKSKTVKLGMNVTNENNKIIAQLMKKDYTFGCVFPQIKKNVTAGGNGELQQHQAQAPAVTTAGNTIQNKPKPNKPAGKHSASNNKAIYKGLPDLKVKGLKVFSDKTNKPSTILKVSEAKQIKGGKCIYEMMYHSKNKGKSKTGSYQNVLKLNGKQIKIENKQQMLPGQSEKIKLNIALKSGLNKLELMLDSKQQVSESIESNNTKIKNIKIIGSCKATTQKIIKSNKNTGSRTSSKTDARLKK